MKKLLGLIKTSASTAELLWKIFTFLVVLSGGTTATVLAAGTTLFGNAGPIAWMGIGLIFSLAFGLTLFLVAGAFKAKAEGVLLTSLSSKSSSINPLQRSFEDLIIPIEALRLPGASIHEYKHFRRCKFVGPGAIAILGGTFVKGNFNNIGHVLTLPEEIFLTGVTALKNCTVEECDFYSVTILVPRKSADSFKTVPGIKIAY